MSSDDDHSLQHALEAALLRLLRPLVRLLLRHAVPFARFEELAKKAYVESAMHDFCIADKRPTMSRASILTGLTRKDVQRLLAGPAERAAADDARHNRAARVLTAWLRDPAFLDEQRQPRALAPTGADGFAELVRRYSGDMPARAVLDELLRVGAVHRGADGHVKLMARGYVPQASRIDKLAILGSDVADLIDTIDHNLLYGATAPRFQRKVMYRRVPARTADDFRRLAAREGQALLERLDAWLAERDAAAPPEGTDSSPVRIGLGIYHFEERLDPETTESKKELP